MKFSSAMLRTIVAGHVLATAVAIPSLLSAQTLVRGTVFDSLTMRPLSGAAIWVQGSAQTAVADSNGRFELKDVPSGEQFIAFSSPALDSLGLGTLGKMFSAATANASAFSLTSPSFATIWRVLCRGQAPVGADSGIAWGTVRDAATESRLSGARTLLQWVEPQADAKKAITMQTISRDVRTDSTGTYYVCGVPVGTNISMESSGSRSTSGVIQYALGPRRMMRFDMMVSAEMVVPSVDASDKNATFHAPRGTSTVRGVLLDEKLNAVADAVVSFASADTSVRTNAQGQFTVSGLPAGTSMLEARRVGYSPATFMMELRPGATQEISMGISKLSELETVTIKAELMGSLDRTEYEKRRSTGLGYAADSKEFEGKADVLAVLQTLPQLTIRRNRGVLSIVPPSSSFMTQCNVVKTWLDGTPSSLDEVSALSVHEIKAVEWFPRASVAPAQYVGLQACPVILFWTTRSRWGK